MCIRDSACPAFDEMDIHPHKFVSMVEKGDIEALMASKSLWTCLSCFACVARCPRSCLLYTSCRLCACGFIFRLS